MSETSFEDHSQTPEASNISLMDVVRLLRSAGRPLIAQSALHIQLARVEWAEEKKRLTSMLLVLFLGYACLLCVMLFGGVLVLAVTWNTELQLPALITLVALFGVGLFIAFQRFRVLLAQSNRAFATTREEIAADIALIKRQL
ncbi:MAG TPA: phage holin family protein [Dongiaceae bacterium]|nr:phage holin family protein [Dongiaceae bacterium]